MTEALLPNVNYKILWHEVERIVSGRAKSKIPHLILNLHEGATSITEFPSRFHHFSSFQQLFGSKLHFCGSAAVRKELERKDQQDDDEHRAGEESDGGPLAAV